MSFIEDTYQRWADDLITREEMLDTMPSQPWVKGEFIEGDGEGGYIPGDADAFANLWLSGDLTDTEAYRVLRALDASGNDDAVAIASAEANRRDEASRS